MTNLSQFSDAMQALVDKASRRVVAINAGDRDAASGILWRSGLIVTADEALGEEEDVELTMPDGGTATGRLRAATLRATSPYCESRLRPPPWSH